MILLEGISVSTGEAVLVRVPLPLQEQPEGEIDGTNKIFASSEIIAEGTIELYLNGLLLMPSHYSHSGQSEVTLDEAPMAGDELLIRYYKVI